MSFTGSCCSVLLHRARTGSVRKKAKHYRTARFPFCIANLRTERFCADQAKKLPYCMIPVLHAYTVLSCHITHRTVLYGTAQNTSVMAIPVLHAHNARHFHNAHRRVLCGSGQNTTVRHDFRPASQSIWRPVKVSFSEVYASGDGRLHCYHINCDTPDVSA